MYVSHDVEMHSTEWTAQLRLIAWKMLRVVLEYLVLDLKSYYVKLCEKNENSRLKLAQM